MINNTMGDTLDVNVKNLISSFNQLSDNGTKVKQQQPFSVKSSGNVKGNDACRHVPGIAVKMEADREKAYKVKSFANFESAGNAEPRENIGRLDMSKYAPLAKCIGRPQEQRQLFNKRPQKSGTSAHQVEVKSSLPKETEAKPTPSKKVPPQSGGKIPPPPPPPPPPQDSLKAMTKPRNHPTVQVPEPDNKKTPKMATSDKSLSEQDRNLRNSFLTEMKAVLEKRQKSQD